MDSERILLYTETKLLGYGESDSSGRWVKLELPTDEDLAAVRGRKNEVFEFALFFPEGTPEAIAKPLRLKSKSDHSTPLAGAAQHLADAGQRLSTTKGPHGDLVNELHRTHFFIAPAVAAEIESDAGVNYDEWVRLQPCAVCGGHEWVEKIGEWRCQYAHVRRADHDGTAYKGLYLGIPLCHTHHNQQHNQGESFILKEMRLPPSNDPLRALAHKYLRSWSHEMMRAVFGVTSLTYVSASQWENWSKKHNLQTYLPKLIRDEATGEYLTEEPDRS